MFPESEFFASEHHPARGTPSQSIRSFDKYLLGVFSVPSTVPSVEGLAGNEKGKNPILIELQF